MSNSISIQVFEWFWIWIERKKHPKFTQKTINESTFQKPTKIHLKLDTKWTKNQFGGILLPFRLYLSSFSNICYFRSRLIRTGIEFTAGFANRSGLFWAYCQIALANFVGLKNCGLLCTLKKTKRRNHGTQKTIGAYKSRLAHDKGNFFIVWSEWA